MLKLKPLIVATALLAVAGSSYVYAQQRFGGDGGPGPRMEFHHRLSVDDVSALANARIAALKAGLELTPDQEKNWPAFESALRNAVQLRIERMKARQAMEQQGQPQTPMSPFDRMARRADNLSKASGALKQIADAGAPLYQSLSDAQKTRFTILSHMLRPHPFRQWREGRNFRGDGQWQRGQERGQGWRHDRQFGENGGMHRMMDNDADPDSRL